MGLLDAMLAQSTNGAYGLDPSMGVLASPATGIANGAQAWINAWPTSPLGRATSGQMPPDEMNRWLGGLMTGMGSGGMGAGGIIKAYHGSPYNFDRFANEAIGSGEGAQAYGWGHYFATNPEVAQQYQRDLSANTLRAGDQVMQRAAARSDLASAARAAGVTGQPVDIAADHVANAIAAQPVGAPIPWDRWLRKNWTAGWGGNGVTDYSDFRPAFAPMLERARALDLQPNPGNFYRVSIDADPKAMVDHDAGWNGQPAAAQHVFEGHDVMGFGDDPQTGGDFYDALAEQGLLNGADISPGSESLHAAMQRYASEQLRNAGVPGIKYWDGFSRARAGDARSRNLVIFDPATISIARKYGLGALTTGGATGLGLLDQPGQ